MRLMIFHCLKQAKIKQDYLAKKVGYITQIDAEKIGRASAALGAGRATKEDDIDFSVGIWVEKRLGDSINKGDVLFRLYANDEAKIDEAKDLLDSAVTIAPKYNKETELIYAVIGE